MARKDITDLMVCEAARDNWAPGCRYASIHDRLAARTGEHPNVVWRAMERAESRGLIVSGPSLRSASLSDAGREFLKAQGVPSKEYVGHPKDPFVPRGGIDLVDLLDHVVDRVVKEVLKGKHGER